MIKENAVAGENIVGLAVIYRNPVGVEFRHRVGASRIKRGGLRLRRLLDQTIEFGSACLIEFRPAIQFQGPHGFKKAQRPQRIAVGRVFRLFEADGNMRLCGKIVDFRRRHLFHDVDQAGRVGHVAVMEDELSVGRVVAEKEMIDTPGVEAGRAPLNTVDLIPLAEEGTPQGMRRPGR